MDGSFGSNRHQILSGTAVDHEAVKIREDAFSICFTKKLIHVSVFILDLDPERVRNSRYEGLNYCRGFHQKLVRPAVEICMTFDKEGDGALVDLRLVDFVLDHTFDKPLSKDEPLQQPIKALGTLAAILTGRQYEEVVYNPKIGTASLMTEVNAMVTAHLMACGRSMVFMNLSPNQNAHPTFSPVASGHAKLEVDAYSRFTSPYLRHDDEVNFASLKALINNNPDPFTECYLQSVAQRCAAQKGKKLPHLRHQQNMRLKNYSSSMSMA